MLSRLIKHCRFALAHANAKRRESIFNRLAVLRTQSHLVDKRRDKPRAGSHRVVKNLGDGRVVGV